MPESEVTSYQYEYAAVPSGTSETQQRAWLKCYSKDGRVILSASFSDLGEGQNSYYEEEGYYHAYYRLLDLPVLIDMLRNEKPIFFNGSHSSETGLVYCRLRTGKEPVGEGEIEAKVRTGELNPWV
jgi:hypothetical protein